MVDLPGVSIPNLNVNPVQAPDVLGNATTLMQLKNMNLRNQMTQQDLQKASRENQDQLDTRQAMSDNTTQDPQTGQPVLNMPKAISDLTSKNSYAGNQLNMAMAIKTQEIQAKQLENQKNQIANTASVNNMAGGILSTVHDQESYDNARQFAKGIPELASHIDNLPETYNPDLGKQLKQYASMSMNAKDQAELQARQQGLTQTETQNARTAGNSLHEQYLKDPQTTEFQRINNAAIQGYTAAKQASVELQKSGETGASDLALLTAFAKMENPELSPRLQTIDMTTFQRSVGAEISAKFGQVFSGEALSPEQRQSMIDLMNSRLETSRHQQIITDSGYYGTAIKQGLDPSVAQLDTPRQLSNYKVTPNPFRESPLEKAPKGKTSEPDLSTVGSAPDDQSAPANSNKQGVRYITQKKFDSYSPEDQAKLKAANIEVR